MKHITWLETILVATLIAAAFAATVMARKAVERARTDDAPEEKTFLAREHVEEQEQSLVRARAERDRVHEKLIDARAELPQRADLVAHLNAYFARIDASVRDREKALASHRKAAASAFKAAKKIYDWNTRVIALRCIAASIAALFFLTFVIVSLPYVRDRLPVHRGMLAGAAVLSIPLFVAYEVFHEAGVIMIAALLVFVLVIVVARATPKVPA